MSENSPSNSGELILAFLLGGVVGGALGALFAPASGKKTRQDLAKLTRHWLDEGEGLLDDGKGAILEQAKKISMAASAAKKAYQE